MESAAHAGSAPPHRPGGSPLAAEPAGAPATREVAVTVVVDGRAEQLEGAPGTSLLRALRRAGLTATEAACEEGECGSCSVLLDGALVCSCLVSAATCEGAEVATVASLVAPDLAAALARHGAVQCGFCTPGMVVAAEALLGASPVAGADGPTGPVEREPSGIVTRPEVVEALAGNLCRCTGYLGIVDAVLDVAAERATARVAG